MNTAKQFHPQQGGFSVAEVALAIGVVAFGLVAVLGVLPAGLTVQKDNREETVIRYDAQYWMTALRAGMQPTDALNQVEWVELEVDDGTGPVIYRAHRPRLGGDGAGPEWPGMPFLFKGHLKQSSWPTDVIGWMSIPDNGTAIGSVKKTARVRAFNGQLFDRIYGRKVLVATKEEYMNEGQTAFHPLPGGEFALSYLLETHIAPDPANANLWRITLTFKWPVLDDPTLKDATKNAADVKTVSSKSFTTLVGLPPKETKARQQLPLDQKTILDVTLPGEKISIEELSALTGIINYASINNTLLAMEQAGLATDIREPEAERASPNMVRPDDKWRMGRTYDTHGLYSLRPMEGLSNGGYPPVFGPFRSEPDRFLGFSSPTNFYFSTFYFFTPDYE